MSDPSINIDRDEAETPVSVTITWADGTEQVAYADGSCSTIYPSAGEGS